MERKVIVIVGPTASGKTYLAAQTAKRLGSEVISADSRQIYKLLSIGTAKPSVEEQQGVKHHFIDELEPDIEYNASRFEKEALLRIKELHESGKIPVVAGGSGLYIKALVDGIMDDVDVDEEYREELIELRKNEGNDYLYELLKAKDVKAASTMLPSNWKRVIRALEVFHITGKSITEFHQEQTRNVNLDFRQFGLMWNRVTLYRNIEARVDKMIETGLVDEVTNILNSGYSKESNSLNTVGYKEIISYLENEISLERTIELIKRNTRRFAKRQMTWFRKDERIDWIDIKSGDDLNKAVDYILSRINLV